MTVDQILKNEEYQIFDRKSIQIAATSLSECICAFANADGGTIAIGVSDKTRRIEGVDTHREHLNDLLRAPMDYCNPSVPIKTEMVECKNHLGKDDHILLMHIEASPLLHANQADEAFIRVGDKNRKLSFQDRMTLMYAKGLRYYEDEPVYGATLDDIDMDFIKDYLNLIHYNKSPEDYLRQNKQFVTVKDNTDQVSTAAILLFGKYPQQFFPRARVRFIRYDGTEAKTGQNMNVIKDQVFEGRLLDQVRNAVDYIKTQMKEKTYLGHDGVFVTEEEYSEFVRTEIVVNAVTHRDYGIKGTDIQIKMFDDRLEVDSPGTFAGMVKKDNIRYTHFSRNPKIAAFLKDYGYVKEYGEGVDRMCRELEAIGLPDPTFNNNTFILKTTIMSAAYEKLPFQAEKVADSTENPAVCGAESGDLLNYPAVHSAESGSSSNYPAVEMIALSEIINLCRKYNYNNATIENITRIYNEIEVNQIFSAAYVRKILDCADSTSRSLISKLKEMKVVVAVKGNGKGKYRFKYNNE